LGGAAWETAIFSPRAQTSMERYFMIKWRINEQSVAVKLILSDKFEANLLFLTPITKREFRPEYSGRRLRNGDSARNILDGDYGTGIPHGIFRTAITERGFRMEYSGRRLRNGDSARNIPDDVYGTEIPHRIFQTTILKQKSLKKGLTPMFGSNFVEFARAREVF
ncbi:MAG: hypothetical protein JWM68_3141, partial [Verrucomicrobiales bacterium]|nr:hypothetical protein [Verrucomicrobiales bacterium]